MSHNEYKNQMDYDSQTKKEEQKEEWWGANNGVICIKYDTQTYMEENFDEWGSFSELIDSRKEDKEKE